MTVHQNPKIVIEYHYFQKLYQAQTSAAQLLTAAFPPGKNIAKT